MSLNDKNMDISIIIVNYNTSVLLEKCLDSIISLISDIEYEIIVVDNNSQDREIKNLATKYTDVNFYFRDLNNGFGAGCNYGFSKSRGKYIFLLNPDTCLVDNMAIDFYNYLENNPDTGVCSALLEDWEGNLQYCFNDFPNIKWELLELTGFLSDRKITKMLNHVLQKSNYTDCLKIDWAIGACLFIRRELYEKLGGFDENYFLYYEDTDLQKRIKHIGKSSIDDSAMGDKIYFLNMHISKLKYFYKYSGLCKVFFVRTINITAYLLRFFEVLIRFQSFESKKIRLRILRGIIKIYFSKKSTVLAK